MRRRDESGSAIVEFTWLAIVLLVPLVYLMLTVFEVQRVSYGVAAASRSAARAFVLSDDLAEAYRHAERAARVALADQGVDDLHLRIDCLPGPADCLQPGSSVRVVVTSTRGLPFTPKILGAQLAPVTVDSTHTEPYGTFREGAS